MIVPLHSQQLYNRFGFSISPFCLFSISFSLFSDTRTFYDHFTTRTSAHLYNMHIFLEDPFPLFSLAVLVLLFSFFSLHFWRRLTGVRSWRASAAPISSLIRNLYPSNGLSIFLYTRFVVFLVVFILHLLSVSRFHSRYRIQFLVRSLHSGL